MAAEQGCVILHVEYSTVCATFHFCDDVCGLPRGVDKLDFVPCVKVDPVTQPIERDAMRLAETCLVVSASCP